MTASNQERILDAAERVFAARGFAAASMRIIAEEAGTSQALLHHHFGTKASLYDAVKRRFTERFEREQSRAEAWDDSPAFIVTVVRGYFQFLSRNPNLARLMSWAQLEGDESPWGTSDGLWQRARAWVVDAKAGGLLRAEVDERLLLVVGAAIVKYWVDNRGFVCRTLSLDPDDPGLDDAYLRQALAILLRGVATDELTDVELP